ncbi:MAG TPA: 2-succinyl-6-hydroxy-2,4-cyclohexadiene-1-carboxylate synthase [Ktedonobacteraceae bacterium]|nr:2-succinyl-6-hydroxy-2,4-cyclohexadiene-1-carboxylate synthase [Ktedonobacteraceae bacterium]
MGKVERRLVSVNGLRMGVTLYGEEHVRQQVLVLLHGFTGSSMNWADLLPGLTVPGRWLIALDMAGHGQSGAPVEQERYTIEHCRADILAVLETLGVYPGEAILLGYSMGGRIALYTAFSGFFRALILESASPGLADVAEREQRRQSDNALAARIEREGVKAFIDYWESLPLFASQNNLPPETRARLRAQRLDNRAVGLANSLRGVGTGVQPSLYGQLGAFTMPVLLLAGELDGKFCQIARQMAASLPRASLQIVSGAGHTTHLEQPDMFVRLVNEFCQAVC